jgi:hypothetical protein
MRLGTLCALAIIAGATWGPVSRADEPAPGGGSWLGRWLSFGKQAGKKDFDDVPLQPTPAPAVNPRAEALAAFHRRSEVCLKLQSIAIATRDEALQLEVERLEQQIWQHYNQLIKGDVP